MVNKSLIFSLVLAVGLLAICGTCFAQQNESVTITSYYPSPYGVYKTLRLFPDTSPTLGDNCTRAGEMAYDQINNFPIYCNGTNWVQLGYDGGVVLLEPNEKVALFVQTYNNNVLGVPNSLPSTNWQPITIGGPSGLYPSLPATATWVLVEIYNSGATGNFNACFEVGSPIDGLNNISYQLFTGGAGDPTYKHPLQYWIKMNNQKQIRWRGSFSSYIQSGYSTINIILAGYK